MCAGDVGGLTHLERTGKARCQGQGQVQTQQQKHHATSRGCVCCVAGWCIAGLLFVAVCCYYCCYYCWCKHSVDCITCTSCTSRTSRTSRTSALPGLLEDPPAPRGEPLPRAAGTPEPPEGPARMSVKGRRQKRKKLAAAAVTDREHTLEQAMLPAEAAGGAEQAPEAPGAKGAKRAKIKVRGMSSGQTHGQTTRQQRADAGPEAAARQERLAEFDAEAASVQRRAQPLGEDRHDRRYWHWQGTRNAWWCAEWCCS